MNRLAGIARHLSCIALLCVLSIQIVWAFDPADPSLRTKSPTITEIPSLSSASTLAHPRKSREELFMEVFKKPSSKLPSGMEVQLIVDGKNCGKIRITFSEDRANFYLPVAPVVAALSDLLKPEILKDLEKKLDAKGRLSRWALVDTGLPTAFDMRRFELSILVPNELRGNQVHHITGTNIDPSTVDAIHPNPFSGYVNMSAKERMYYPQRSGINNDHRDPLTVNLDSAWNWHGLVLEGQGLYLESADHPLQRQDLRLVYDNPKEALRYTAGDLQYPVVGYQSIINVGGVGVSKDFSLKPYVNAYPVSQFEFYLESPATVDIWVNDSLVGTLNLAPGTHDIRDFPFSHGENDVRIVITDIFGRVQDLRFSFIHEPLLLASGLTQYSYNFGLRRWIEDDTYTYASDDPFVSMLYQKGMSDVFTLGGYLQGLSDQAMGGFEGIYALSYGIFQVDAALSAVEEMGLGWATKIAFTHVPKRIQSNSGISWRSEIEYLSHSFTRITSPCADNTSALNLSSYVNFSLGYGVSTNIGAGYTFTRGEDVSDRYSLSAGLQRYWLRNLSSNLTVEYTHDQDGDREVNAFFGVSWLFPARNQSLSASKASRGDLDVRWDYNQASSLPERARASACAKYGQDRDEYEAKLGYTGNRGIVDLSQKIIDHHDQDDSEQQNQTDITLQSALVYVDGNLALSRPVCQSFVLVKGEKNLKDSEIVINPSTNGYQAASSRFGPAVLPTLSPYSLKKVVVQPVDPPAGYLLENPYFTLSPTYKSGYALYVGSDSMVIVIGRLVDGTSGEPVGHQPLEVISLEDKRAEPIHTFTSRKGQFQLLGLKQGTYEIRPTESSEWGEVIFTIPDGTEGVYRIGELTLPKKP
jgi:outer membrane usher protein